MLKEAKMKDLKVVTNYNEELIKKYMIDHFFIRTKKVKIIINIIIIVCTILTVLLIINTKTISNFSIICLFIYLIGFIEFNTSILPNRSFKKLKKSSKVTLNVENNYTFSKENIKIATLTGSSTINYQDIYQCIEVKNAYYIYISDRQAFIVDKEQLSQEENEKLGKILSSKIKNYTKINK